MSKDIGIAFTIYSKLDNAIGRNPVKNMTSNCKNSQFSFTDKAKISPFSDSFDFERWVRQVRPRMLAALQKRAANSPRKGERSTKV
jgi:hypothetical protein